jgi:hypothetical protein
MILGYDFVEERLFAFRDYAGLSEKDAKLLRYYRDTYANNLKLAKDAKRDFVGDNFFKNILKNASDDMLKNVRDPEYHRKNIRFLEDTAKQYIKEGNSKTAKSFKNLSKGAKLQAKVLEDRAKAEKLPFYKTKGDKLAKSWNNVISKVKRLLK